MRSSRWAKFHTEGQKSHIRLYEKDDFADVSECISGNSRRSPKLGMEPRKARINGKTRKGYWAIAGSGMLKTTITNERLAQAGYFDIPAKYESLRV